MHRFQRWREALQGAHTAREVEVIMRDYVNSFAAASVRLRYLPGASMMAPQAD